MIYNASLILEGGAMMGIYTSGVLDVLMKNNIYVTHAIGVSAGSANAIDYAAMQPERTKNCMALTDKKLRFFGIESIKRTGRFYDFEMCFQTFADVYFPFDYETFYRSPVECEVVVTDVLTGKPAYIKCAREGKQAVKASRASSSLPFLSDIYECDGIKCLDGGVADSIPYERALTYGNDKLIIVLTKPEDYIKSPPGKIARMLTGIKYKKYPNMVKAINDRYIMYNKQIKAVNKLESDGRAFVFRPARNYVGRMENDYGKLMIAYNAGIEDAERRLKDLINYLEDKA